MLKSVAAAAFLVLLTFFVPQSARADNVDECTPNSPRFPDCVDDVATYACRAAKSQSAMLGCFTDKAREILGKNYKDYFFGPDCIKENDLAATCSIAPGVGDGDGWCYRIDPTTVAYCTGDPPNQKCQIRNCGWGRICKPYNCGAVLVPWK